MSPNTIVNLIICKECYILFVAPLPVAPLPLPPPTNVAATAQSCYTVTLQWNQPSEPNDIIASVRCTPPSPGCDKCTTSPCNITGLNPSTEYEFYVTLNSGQCRTNMSSDKATTSEYDQLCQWCMYQYWYKVVLCVYISTYVYLTAISTLNYYCMLLLLTTNSPPLRKFLYVRISVYPMIWPSF